MESLCFALLEEQLSRERLDGNDKKVLLIWILAGLLGAGVAYKYFFQAFPEASIQFKVPRAAALDEARKFAISQGAQLATVPMLGYADLSTFKKFRFFPTRRVLHCYLTLFKSELPLETLSSMYLDVF